MGIANSTNPPANRVRLPHEAATPVPGSLDRRGVSQMAPKSLSNSKLESEPPKPLGLLSYGDAPFGFQRLDLKNLEHSSPELVSVCHWLNDTEPGALGWGWGCMVYERIIMVARRILRNRIGIYSFMI